MAGLSSYLMVCWGLFADVIRQLNQARTAATQELIMTTPALTGHTDTRRSQRSKLYKSMVYERLKLEAKKSPLALFFGVFLQLSENTMSSRETRNIVYTCYILVKCGEIYST